jgi:transcriptional regulator with XRE-family HTH domain
MSPGAFRAARKEMHMTQADLATAMGLKSGRMIRAYEAGRARISDRSKRALELLLDQWNTKKGG